MKARDGHRHIGKERQKQRLESKAVMKALQQPWPGKESQLATEASCKVSVLPTWVAMAKETLQRLSEQQARPHWGVWAG